MSTDARALRAAVDDLDERVKALAVELYDLDDDTSVDLLTTSGAWTGASAERADAAASVLPLLWGAWAVARDATDHADGQLANGDLTGADATLALARDRGDGTSVDLVDLVAWLEEASALVRTTARTLADAHAEDIVEVDRLRARWAVLTERAGTAGRSTSGTVLLAKAELETYAAAVAADPIGARPEDAVAAFAAAEEEVATALASRDALGARLARAGAMLDELRVLIPSGARALATAREKIAAPEGLLEPLAPDVLEAPPLGLAPWLERIRAVAETRWQSAVAGLDRWERVADVHLANARAVDTANAAPLARRDELRGLLGALRAKAGAMGLAEDPVVTQLHDDAHALLHVAPCPLDEAATRVDAYRAHLAAQEPVGHDRGASA